MNDIEVGEYVRTRHGKIGKVIDITNITGQKREKYLINWNKAGVYYITGVTITKHSKNIIDIVEVGDYVNGEKVDCSAIENGEKIVYCNECEGLYSQICKIKDIKTILTHEQMEANCYKVGE